MKKVLSVLLVLVMLAVVFFGFGNTYTVIKANSLPGKLGLMPSWQYRFNVPHISLKNINADELPSSVDLSNMLPPVGDQGQQGSCVAWAVGYYYKTFTEHKEQNWDVTTNAHQFSPAFIYNQINGGNDNGSTFQDAFQLLEDKGCDTLKIFPYNDQDYTTQPTQDQLNLAVPFKIENYGNLFYGRYVNSLVAPSKNWHWEGTPLSDRDIDDLKGILANGSVFVIGIPVFATWYRSDFGPNDYIHYVPSDGEVTFYGYHAVTLVGYDDMVHGGAFRMVNSWSTSWGDNGYTWITYDWIKQCAEEGWSMTELSPDFTVKVTSPNGGETYNSGDSCTIKWNSSDAGGGNAEFAKYASLYYIQNNTIHSIATNINNTGSYVWNIPSNVQGNIKVRVKIMDDTYTELATDDSDSTFTINSNSSNPPTVTLTYPNGGETLTAGDTINVTWTIDGDTSQIDHISVDYTTDNGATWHYAFSLSSGFSSSMSHPWTLPNVDSSQCKLRIGLVRTDHSLSVDKSDSTFTIQP